MKLQDTIMSALTLPPPAVPVRLPLLNSLAVRPPAAELRRLLLFSDDKNFSQSLLKAANETRRLLATKPAAPNAVWLLRLLRPAVVLLDLDSPTEASWETADSLLQQASSPPLLLLTSRTDQVDFNTAIQAGLLFDKRERPIRLLELAYATMEGSATENRKRHAMQRIGIRWLKPCAWSAIVPLRRHWGINE